MRFTPLLIGLLCFLGSCSAPSSSGYNVKVALDPTWRPLIIPGRENNVTAFSLELIEAIGKTEHTTIGIYQRSWSNLILGLETGDYLAICTSMQPYLFYEKTYIFSDIYLETGLVLVTTVESTWSSLDQLAGHEVAVLQPSVPLLEKYPRVIQRPYTSIQQAFNDLKEGLVDAALVDRLTAQAFVADLYAGQLKISSPPLTSEGLRLMGQKSKAETFINKFNQGLADLKTKGTYQKTAQKWGLML